VELDLSLICRKYNNKGIFLFGYFLEALFVGYLRYQDAPGGGAQFIVFLPSIQH